MDNQRRRDSTSRSNPHSPHSLYEIEKINEAMPSVLKEFEELLDKNKNNV